jgi:hypothetical protein
MHINVGDLVECRKKLKQIGIVVKKHLANECGNSLHAQKTIESLPSMYYIYFSAEHLCDGPFSINELTLKQSIDIQ